MLLSHKTQKSINEIDEDGVEFCQQHRTNDLQKFNLISISFVISGIFMVNCFKLLNFLELYHHV